MDLFDGGFCDGVVTCGSIICVACWEGQNIEVIREDAENIQQEIVVVVFCLLCTNGLLLGLYWKLGVDNERWYVNDIHS